MAKQFDLGVRQIDEHRADAVIRLFLLCRNVGTERVPVDRGRGLDVRNRDGDVIEPSDHA